MSGHLPSQATQAPLVGVLGGGQLGLMLGLAGIPLGLRFRFLDPNPDSPAARVGELILGEYHDPRALERFASGLSVATFEFENVPAFSASFLTHRAPTFPGPRALEVCQDRLLEKQLFTELGIVTTRFVPVENESELRAAIDRIGLPCVVKSRRMGYDGKGQAVVRSPADLHAARALLGVPLIVESFVPFDFEVSVIGARARPKDAESSADLAVYPLTRNRHVGGILRVSIAGDPSVEPLMPQATSALEAVAQALHYAGVLTIEFFVKDGQLIANEIAPRVHNSGHWTIEGAACSQFENHLRVILGWPLGSTAMRAPAAVMVNLIGEAPPLEQLAAEPGVSVHWYGKEPRAGRKVGHLTVLESSAVHAAQRAEALHAMVNARTT
jgi:5-(carboxyamino)imidazole ribonucleotide synthase